MFRWAGELLHQRNNTCRTACGDEYSAAEKTRLSKEGRLIDDFDLLIGCSAAVCGLILITDSTSHLARINGLQLDNWAIRDK